MNLTRLLVIFALLALVASFFIFDLQQFLSLEYIKAQQTSLQATCEANIWSCSGLFFVLYVIVTGASLPGAGILTLVAGALFGLLLGTIIVSFASVAGATVAFLITRYLLRDFVQQKFGDKLKPINKGVEKDGAFYLFTIRMIPVFPFFIVNALMALTPIKTFTFAWVSQVGMLAITAVFVFAGTQLAKINALGDILSPALLTAIVLVGIFPLIAKKIIGIINMKRIYKDYPKPESFDANLIVIGAGSAGLVSSYIASQINAKVVLIEETEMGGDCLNRGCVPSKALIASAKIANMHKHSAAFGIKLDPPQVDFPAVMDHVQSAIKTIEPVDSVERYTELGVEVVKGYAKIISPYVVEVNGRQISGRNIIIAAGAKPFVPPIPGVEDSGYLTSDTLWQLQKRPDRLVVLGGGPIGCEMAQSFARLGSRVTIVEMLPHIMANEDQDLINDYILPKFAADGIDVKTSYRATKFENRGEEKVIVCERDGENIEIAYDAVIAAVGRKANVTGYGLKELGVELTERGTVTVNEYLQTNFPNIFACGDVAGPYQFTHTASHQAYFATVNALFGSFKKTAVDYSVIPWATFTDPEVARVGLNETEAKKQNINYETTEYDLAELDRAITERENKGRIRVLTPPGKDKILGVTIVGHNAGELIAEFVLAMRHKLGLNKILGTIHTYPTWMEANKFTAGAWRRNNKPEKVLKWLGKFHKWRLG